MAANGDRCERCWGKTALAPYPQPGGRAVVLCRACREGAPLDPVVFREVFMRFGSAKEMISHYSARDEPEAIRKLCIERRLDYKTVVRAIESHGQPAGSPNGFLDFTRPYGYELRDGGLKVRPEEAKTVGVIFEMYLHGMGIAKICRELNAAKISTKTGKEWASQSVANVLRNPLYAGFTKDNGSLRHGKHRPIVDAEVFSDVQVRMEQRIRRPDQKRESRLFQAEARQKGVKNGRPFRHSRVDKP